jgi:hypothetical protein
MRQDRRMKLILLLVLLPLAGCGAVDTVSASVTAGLTIGSIATIQRSPPDAIYSLLTGRDCSIVRLDAGKTYCRPVEPAPEPPAYCTPSLGRVDCWADPGGVPGHPRAVADGPVGLTAAQEADRVRTWP